MPKSIWNGTISFGLAHVPIKLYSAVESKTVSFREVHLSDGAPIEHQQAAAVIESLAADWDPERYTDCYRERLKRVVKQKQKGERVKAPSEPKQPKPAPDLMEALQATLERMGDGKGGGRSRHKAKAGTR